MKRLAVLVMALIFVPACATLNPWSSSKNLGYYGDVEASVVRVIDGDTIVVTIAKYPPLFGENISVRLAGIDAPEPNEPGGKEAKAFVDKLLKPGDKVKLLEMQRGKYFRISATVRIKPGLSLADLLVQNNLAKLDSKAP